jgi:hypothetical protein
LSCVDPDAGDVCTYTLVPGAGDNTSFEIIGNELRVAVPLDFTLRDQYSIQVRSTDQAGAFVEEVFIVSAPAAHVLWTRSDTGRAVQWRIDPSAAGGSPKIIPVSDLASLQSTTGVGSPWQATGYFRIGQVREGTEQESFNPTAPEGASWFGTEVETGIQAEAEIVVGSGIEWMMVIGNEQEFWIAQQGPGSPSQG